MGRGQGDREDAAACLLGADLTVREVLIADLAPWGVITERGVCKLALYSALVCLKRFTHHRRRTAAPWLASYFVFGRGQSCAIFRLRAVGHAGPFDVSGGP